MRPLARPLLAGLLGIAAVSSAGDAATTRDSTSRVRFRSAGEGATGRRL